VQKIESPVYVSVYWTVTMGVLYTSERETFLRYTKW